MLGKEKHGSWFRPSRGKHSRVRRSFHAAISPGPSRLTQRDVAYQISYPLLFPGLFTAYPTIYPGVLRIFSLCLPVPRSFLYCLCLSGILHGMSQLLRKPSIWTQMGRGADGESASNEPIAENLSRELTRSDWLCYLSHNVMYSALRDHP